MNRSFGLVCTAIFVSTAAVCNGQTASISTNKPRNAGTSSVRPPVSKASGTNTVGRAANGVVSRVHMKIRKDVEPEFLKLVNGKKAILEDIRVIQRIVREKQAGLDRINVELAAAYSIDGDRNYRYDVQTRTIYEISLGSPTAAAADGAGTDVTGAARTPATDSRRVHMTLDDKERADKFIQLTAAKQLASVAVRVLSLLEQEKATGLMRNNNALLERFGMSRDRGYEYDVKTGILYELIAVPSAEKASSR